MIERKKVYGLVSNGFLAGLSLLLLYILVEICSSPGRRLVLYEPSPAVLGVEIGLTAFLAAFAAVRFVQVARNRRREKELRELEE